MTMTSSGTKGRRSVELLISCTDLADLDVFTLTDPMCVLFVKQFGQWKEYGRTEAIKETLNPGFAKSFIIEYEPTIQQPLLFSVYDIDSKSMDLHNHDFVGSVEMTMEEVVGEDDQPHTTSKTLRVPGDPKSRGVIHVTSEFMKSRRGKVQIHVTGFRLDHVGLLRKKPDTYLEIGRQMNSITYQPVFRTEVVTKTRNPWWRPFDLSVQKICNDDWDRSILFSVWHNDGAGFKGRTLIGQCATTLRKFANEKTEDHYRTLELVCPKKEKNNKKKTSVGSLRFYQFRVEMQYSLLEYVQGGLRLRLITAIDFTASNGVITDPLSLHTLEEARSNQYLNALESLGSVIARYDPEQKVAAFGFGAKRSTNSPTEHCLQLTSDVWNKGIKGVSEAYHEILPSLTFAGPTYIAPILDKVMDISDVSVEQDNQTYFVLLVITDGIINDMDQVVQKLIDASSLPLSVIILGVGPSDFTLMEQFHQNSNAPLFDSTRKKKAERSNCHFAALKPDGFHSGAHGIVIQEALAALSSQVLQYMKDRCLTPGQQRMTRVDPGKCWVDPTTVLDGEEGGDPLAYLNNTLDSLNMTSVGSAASLSTMKSSLRRTGGSVNKRNNAVFSPGFHCPTCGSFLEPGSALYDDFMHLS